MSVCEVQSNSKNSLALIGSLDWFTVPTVSKELLEQMSQASDSEITLNLSQLESADTAGLACLVNCSVACKKNGKSLLLKEVPTKILKLAKISDVDTILTLQ